MESRCDSNGKPFLEAGEKNENYEFQYRAADWNLSSPDWTGRMRVMEKSQKVDKTED